MKELEIKVAAFIASQNVKTISGAEYDITSFQKDCNGNIAYLVGTVKEKSKQQRECQLSTRQCFGAQTV